ncbi:MAG: F0F1 ATP synthase subunit B [Azospirillaceae bacterium]|nr:F0F1 ATP synthase subunit B [Azospirillaceae bacterium]
MIHNAEFWVALAFVIFFVVLWKKIASAVTSMLDQRAEKVRAELREAQHLREEAEQLLARAQKQQQEALADAEKIVAHARSEAERLGVKATADVEDQLNRRRAQALEKIAQAETAALQEVRNLTVDIAMAATGRLLAEQLQSAQAGMLADALVDHAIAELSPKLH